MVSIERTDANDYQDDQDNHGWQDGDNGSNLEKTADGSVMRKDRRSALDEQTLYSWIRIIFLG